MPTLLRRAALPSCLVLLVVSLAGQSPTPAPNPAQTARPLPPDAAAFQAAGQIREPAARLAALEKFRTDFPQSTSIGLADNQILSVLVANWPERTDAIVDVFDRIVNRIPSGAPPETRLTSLITPVNQLVGKKLMLDRSEELIASALSALDETKYAEAQRATATRLNQPAPAPERLRSNFGGVRSRGLEVLARIAVAKGDAAKAESLYKEAVDANPAFGPAVTSLVDIYTSRKEYDKAEAVLKASIKVALSPAVAARPTMALADLYEKKGDEPALEALLGEAMKASPPPAGAAVKLAKLEARRGNTAKALELFVAAAAQGSIPAADDSAMRELYRSQHNGSDAGLDTRIDEIYREKFPNPVKPQAYTPSSSRTNRLVLLEMFTGSGCGPCVAADLAFDAVMERYPAGTIVPLAYHQNIPAPDPMVTTGSVARKDYYQVRGVPTFNIDGALGRLGGGGRTNTEAAYRDYVGKIDKALETPALAEVSVSATGEGDRITAIADVSKLPADAKDLRLHILLVERDVRFSGENGIRFHPMSVRGSAGENGNGIPITSTGKTEHTFSLSAIKEDITRTLQAEMERRRRSEQPGATPREYAADGRPHVNIDPAHLSVVAFVQQGAYRPPAGPTTPAAGVESSVETTPILGAPPAPARPATTGPLANVLQAAIAEVVFPAARR